MIRRTPIETKINHERWLVSYSDFITLLFGFFVVMYSVSQVNENKYRVLSDTLSKAFDHNATSTAVAQPPDQLAKLDDVASQLMSALDTLVSDQSVAVFGNESWVEIEVDSNLLFASGSAEPNPQAKTIFAEVADILGPYENAVAVSGHTDDVPLRQNARFHNNWELSAARAAAVVDILALNGVAPKRLSAVGFGEFQPVADNTSDEGRAKNRRVVLRVARERAEVPRAAADKIISESGVVANSGEDTNLDNIVSNGINDARNQDGNDGVTGDAGDEAPSRELPDGRVKPVKLPSGGLLFSSDPDLPRNNN